MFLDLQNYHPEEPRVPTAISVREGVLLSLVVHLIALLVYVLVPKAAPSPAVPLSSSDPVQFIALTPPAERMPRNLTREVAPKPTNLDPLVRGTTPEKVVGAPPEPDKTTATTTPDPASPPATAALPDPLPAPAAAPAPAVPDGKPGGVLRDSLRNLDRFLHTESYQNPTGGNQSDLGGFQFDDRGVDFGPWIDRFKKQIQRNWNAPQSIIHGHVVFQFYVLKNGTITDIRIVQPSTIEAYNLSAMTALKLSNPTLKLPDEYPTDRVLFTVTFYYNEGIRDPR